MKHFNTLDLPSYSIIKNDLDIMLRTEKIHWHHGQICLTTTINHPDDFTLGTGSLTYNWDDRIKSRNSVGNTSIELPKNTSGLTEQDFTILCTQFKGTVFEDIFNMLNTHYKIGRLRLMKSEPKGCYTWHTDPTPRIHYPIKTQEGCFMVIEDEILHLKENEWYYTNTVKKHTAFNGSKESRIHLVGVLL